MPRLDARPGLGLDDRRVRDAAGLDLERKARDAARGRLDGRTVEIQRLIGRVAARHRRPRGLGERTVWVDCDVIQADGGTRCAAISGGYVALHRALAGLVDGRQARRAAARPTRSRRSPSASSTASRVLDLPYVEDVRAETDMNVVMTGDGRFVEVQGTAEGEPFGRARPRRAARARRAGHHARSAALQLRACAAVP